MVEIAGRQMVNIDGYLVKKIDKEFRWEEYNTERFDVHGAGALLGCASSTVLRYIADGLINATVHNERGIIRYTIEMRDLKSFVEKVQSP